MAQKIRDDLIGVVLASDEDGKVVSLSAGDSVPEGVVVGDHALIEEASDAEKATRSGAGNGVSKTAKS